MNARRGLQDLKKRGPLDELLADVPGSCSLGADVPSVAFLPISRFVARSLRVTYRTRESLPDDYVTRPLLALVLVLAALTVFLKPLEAKLIFEPATTTVERAKLRPSLHINVRKLRYWKKRIGVAKKRNLIRERQLAAHVAGLKALRGRPLADLVLHMLAEHRSHWRGFVANSADPHLYKYDSVTAQVS